MSLIAYRPERLDVRVGTTVTWRQRDAGTHTVTSGSVTTEPSGAVESSPDGTFESGELSKDESFDFTFDQRGAYAYFCRIHPATMRGRVRVE